ncbi:ABC transporter [Bacillus sp. USDA818B3_A]|uniref:ABC transporter n=1 Tax=Bacillus sp. USDA818B3_A TaxID=2698834 RepID=UPI00136C7AA5|nr:ABC transporter [Bacillus sp. USDA818B3_A]
MSNNHSCWGLFHGFLAAVFWVLFLHLGWLHTLLAALGLGGAVILIAVIKFIIALIAILAFLIFGLCLFKKAWHHCK